MSDTNANTGSGVDSSDQWVLDFADSLQPPAATTGEAPEIQAEKAKHTYEDFDFDDLQTYAGLDGIATSELLARLFPIIVKPRTIITPDEKGRRVTKPAPAIIESVENIEMKAHEFIIDLEINGIAYDVEENRRIAKKMVAEMAELDDRIASQIGCRPTFLDSGVQMAEFLYRKQGLVPPSHTKSGDPATDGDALLTLAGLDPLKGKYVAPDPSLQYLADMAKRKDINSVYNTFVRTYVEDWVKRDGRVHPSYNLHGTSSFRITGSDPNLTQLPRPKHGYNVRTCYTVAPGFVFISFDFSSAEVKILANLSKEPAMLKAIRDGLDFHTFSASAMLGIPYDEMAGVLANDEDPKYKEYKNWRQIAKTWN